MIIINGKKYNYNGDGDVSIIDGVVLVDGKPISDLKKDHPEQEIEIIVQGNVNDLNIKNGNVSIEGDIKGDISGERSNIDCKTVEGNVITERGNVKANTIYKNATSHRGNISAQKIEGNVLAERGNVINGKNF